MAAAGIRHWRDISHGEGRWRKWAEMQAAFPSLKGQRGCAQAYNELLQSLRVRAGAQGGEEEMEGWWRDVRRNGGGKSAADWEERADYNKITAARRTAEGSWGAGNIRWTGKGGTRRLGSRNLASYWAGQGG